MSGKLWEEAMADHRPAIFITGAASGIGLATARRFALAGWFVGLADVNQAGLKAALADVGPGNGLILPLDVRDRAQWAEAIERFGEATGGRCDILFNNAGIGRYGWFEDIDPAEADLEIDVNLKGVINGAYAGLPLLKATPGSRLINMASSAGLYGPPRLAVYGATKFAVRGLSEALDAEFVRHGVQVKCIMPWYVETPILDSATRGSNASIRDSVGNQPVYTVEEAAEVVWTAAHSAGLHHMVGKAAKRLSIVARFMPNGVRKRLRAMVAAS
jgi:NAD(P)-dependent dehydrogenase (short-subunit alcohol dehydrogenase family)